VSHPYEVRISARAERDLLRLPEKIAGACLDFIFGPLADDPYRLGGALSGHLAGLRSARRGSYRIVYSVSAWCAQALTSARSASLVGPSSKSSSPR
jgi:mRNA-degrading endonuclease RelE of RelBE toxin-antitoxin system